METFDVSGTLIEKRLSLVGKYFKLSLSNPGAWCHDGARDGGDDDAGDDDDDGDGAGDGDGGARDGDDVADRADRAVRDGDAGDAGAGEADDGEDDADCAVHDGGAGNADAAGTAQFEFETTYLSLGLGGTFFVSKERVNLVSSSQLGGSFICDESRNA